MTEQSQKKEFNALNQGLKLMGTTLESLINESQEIMRMNPINSLVMLNLYANLGYAMFNEPNKDGQYLYGGVTYSTRKDMIAEVFRDSAEKTGAMISTEALSNVFSMKFDLSKLAGALGA